MTRALFDQSAHKRRFGGALAVAIVVHLAAISLATTQRLDPKTASGFSGKPSEIIIEPMDPKVDPQEDSSEPSPPPPLLDESFIEQTATPPPVYRQITKLTPVVRSQKTTNPGSMSLSSARVFALVAPRPQYPYEARRQKITGDGIALITIDLSTGNVVEVTMSRSTGNAFLDNAAVTGFKRWRFKAGTVSTVTCPITFTLTGADY
jgi:TonB family protein